MIASREAGVIKKELKKIRMKIELCNLNDEANKVLIESLDHLASEFALWIEMFQGFLDEKQATHLRTNTE